MSAHPKPSLHLGERCRHRTFPIHTRQVTIAGVSYRRSYNIDCYCPLSSFNWSPLTVRIDCRMNNNVKNVAFPFAEHCAGAGLYVQSSNEQRSTQCTYLQQGHNYLSDSNSLYINFYSHTPTVRGGFWMIYEGDLDWLSSDRSPTCCFDYFQRVILLPKFICTVDHETRSACRHHECPSPRPPSPLHLTMDGAA